MRLARNACASLYFTVATVMTAGSAGPANAASCADFFPFICLFGPEAEARQPARVVLVTDQAGALTYAPVAAPAPADAVVAAAPAPARKMRMAAKTSHKKEAKPEAYTMLAAIEIEEAAAPVAVAPPAPSEPEAAVRRGPGPAFAMSLRLTPAMQEPVNPPSSACVVEQTFNELFRSLPLEMPRKVVEAPPESPAHPFATMAIRTGVAKLTLPPLADAMTEMPELPIKAAAAPEESPTVTQ